jgi:hypothetical protein
LWRHIVQHDDFRASRNGVPKLIGSSYLDFDLHQVRSAGARQLYRSADAA